MVIHDLFGYSQTPWYYHYGNKFSAQTLVFWSYNLMSVYTVVSLTTLQDFAHRFGLEVVSLMPIKGGIENTNYFVTLTDGREYVLTLFEVISAENAHILADLMQRLADHGLPVAVPLADAHGERIQTVEGKPAQLAPRLPGTPPNKPTLAQITAIGSALAGMHLALMHDPLQHDTTRETTHSHRWWQAAQVDLRANMPPEHQALLDDLLARYADALAEHPDLPQGLIHADLFRDNTLYVGDQLGGILDFSEMHVHYWLLDLAITMNDFCSTWEDAGNTVSLDRTRAQTLLDAYTRVRALTNDEEAALPVFLAVAACRFWFLRLGVAAKNEAQDRGGADVQVKDPEEMRRMVVDRLRLSNP